MEEVSALVGALLYQLTFFCVRVAQTLLFCSKVKDASVESIAALCSGPIVVRTSIVLAKNTLAPLAESAAPGVVR